jgi:hypothetical protein
MQDILAQIEAANAAGLYYVALFTALAIPDICAALETADGQAKGYRYIRWFDQNIPSGTATGQDIYQYRCSLLHQGRTAHPNGKFSRIIFIEPGATTNTFHNCVIGDALLIDVQLFVSEVVEAAKLWLKSAEQTEIFQRNFAAFVARLPNGLKPYVDGVSVIG